MNTDGIPLTIVVNGAGQIVGRVEGAANWDTPATVSAILALTGQAGGGTGGAANGDAAGGAVTIGFTRTPPVLGSRQPGRGGLAKGRRSRSGRA